MANTHNGLSICKIHAAAFDGNIVGIDPDLVVNVLEDNLREIAGPMPQHGINEIHGEKLSVVPRPRQDQPSRDGLSERILIFKRA